MRTCLGCRSVRPQGELLRFGVDAEGQWRIADGGGLNGRTGYVCPNEECIARLGRKDTVARALRRPHGPIEKLQSELICKLR